ncbi:MAG: DUF1801 domain-containing protein [Flavobacteriales bacterium]|jgi:uncharacterized protein YdhG (YjbR/CyaY superfamily)|nr:DUF1801 domain-containing protein [Flavobacteriales bacterium]
MDAIDTYINGLAADRRDTLMQVRRVITEAWPQATADMSAGMPTFHLRGHAFCALADRKHFMVVHIVHYDLLKVFRHDLLPHDHGRSCIRFTRTDPGLLLLLGRVVKYCGDRMAESIHYGRPHRLRGPLARSPRTGRPR